MNLQVLSTAYASILVLLAPSFVQAAPAGPPTFKILTESFAYPKGSIGYCARKLGEFIENKPVSKVDLVTDYEGLKEYFQDDWDLSNLVKYASKEEELKTYEPCKTFAERLKAIYKSGFDFEESKNAPAPSNVPHFWRAQGAILGALLDERLAALSEESKKAPKDVPKKLAADSVLQIKTYYDCITDELDSRYYESLMASMIDKDDPDEKFIPVIPDAPLAPGEKADSRLDTFTELIDNLLKEETTRTYNGWKASYWLKVKIFIGVIIAAGILAAYFAKKHSMPVTKKYEALSKEHKKLLSFLLTKRKDNQAERANDD